MTTYHAATPPPPNGHKLGAGTAATTPPLFHGCSPPYPPLQAAWVVVCCRGKRRERNREAVRGVEHAWFCAQFKHATGRITESKYQFRVGTKASCGCCTPSLLLLYCTVAGGVCSSSRWYTARASKYAHLRSAPTTCLPSLPR